LQKIPIFFGEGGNGKGVLFNAIQRLIGNEAVSALPMHSLGMRFNNDLQDKWINIDADLSETSKNKEGMLKKYADKSKIRYEGKFKNPITAACFAMFFFATNLLFAFRDRSNGMGRRVVYIPCNACVDKGQVVQKLEDTFCMSGVLNRVLQVVPALVGEGLIDCPAVNELTKQARQEANPASLFLQERISLRTGSKLIKKEVYRVYRDWCEDNGYKPLSHLNFGREVARHFSKQVKSGEVNLSGKVSEYAVRHNAYVGIEYRIDRVPKRNESKENLPAKKLSNSDSSADEHREIEAMLERIGESGK
jgi:putative DNA primase/helicase